MQLKEMRPTPVRQLARKKVDGRMVNVKDEEGHVIYRVKEDRTIDNVWRVPCIQPADKTQRMGYPTQKPEALLKRVIEASSNEGDVVLDPFCGCSTTIAVAQQLKRKWIGIDITHLAIGLIKYRLLHAFGLKPKKDYAVVREPTTLEGARQLAADDTHQFEHWALGLVGARASAKGKGKDKGIDGQLSFQEGGPGSDHKRVFISVKSGKVDSSDVRDLRGVVEREEGVVGLLIILRNSTKDMRAEAADAGFYESPWGKHRRLQILTVEELLGGKQPDLPPIQPGGTTFKKPKKASTDEQVDLPLGGD